MASAILAVSRPCNLLFTFKDDPGCFKAIHTVAVNISADESCHDLIQFHDIFRFFDQRHLKHPIIQMDVFSGNVFKPPTETEFVTMPYMKSSSIVVPLLVTLRW
mgnify:CR=1 FL=1